NDDALPGCDGRVRCKDAGSARSIATGATEDAAACRPARPGGPSFILRRVLKLLVLTSSYPTPEAPVAGIFVREYAQVAARSAEVEIAHLERGGASRIRVERQQGEELPTLRVRYPRGPGSLAWHLAAARAAWSALPFEPDLIFAHFVVAGVPAVILGRLHRKPVAISENWGIFLPDNPDPVTLRLRLAARFAFGRADLVLPASDAMARALRGL